MPHLHRLGRRLVCGRLVPSSHVTFDMGSECYVTIALGAAAAVLMIGYVLYRKLTVTRQKIEFEHPQDGVSGLMVEIREDSVRHVYLTYRDGTISEIVGR